MIMSESAEKIIARDDTGFLKNRNTTIAIAMNAKMIALVPCFFAISPKVG